MSTTKIKVVCGGPTRSGKTSFAERVTYGKFSEDVPSTIGVDFMSVRAGENQEINVQVWDTAGQERFRALLPSFIKDSDVGLLMIDGTNKEMIKKMDEWIDLFKEVPKVFVVMTHCEGDEMDVRDLGVDYPVFKVSNKTGEGVNDVMSAVLDGVKVEKIVPKTKLERVLKEGGDERVVAMMNSLDQGCTSITLNYLSMTDIGATSVAEQLTSSHLIHGIKKLDLSFNEISDDGAIALAQALTSEECTISTVALNFNNIGDNGAIAMADMLQENTSIKILEMNGNNDISFQVLEAFNTAINVNETIRVIDLENEQLDQDDLKEMQGNLMQRQ